MDEFLFDDRRRLLKLAAAAATTLWLPRGAWSQPRLASDPFTLGVASGSPMHDSVVLWTRLLPAGGLGNQSATVRWEIADDDKFTKIVSSGQAQALPELAHSVHVEARGLAPDRWYFYRFMLGDAVSPVGRTRTFPAPDAPVQKLRLAYASCARWEHGYYAAWAHVAHEAPDLVLFLGDYIYEYAGASNAVRTPTGGVVITLSDYRNRYALHRGEPELQAMHAACPWVVTWDDHEVQNDYAGLVQGDTLPQAPDFAVRRAAAYQAFYEHMPVRSSALIEGVGGLLKGAETRLYSQQRIGRLASLVVIDDRQYRDRHACTPRGRFGSGTIDPATCDIWNDPKRTLLGEAQERWLDGAFERSNQGWTLVAQQTLFGQRDFQPGPGQMLWNDGWDGYPAARSRFTASLQRTRASGPVLLGGDVHENWVGHVKADYAHKDSAPLGVEFCGTSITSRTSPLSGNDKVPAWLAENPHFVFADTERKGYGVVELTPSLLTTTLRVVDDVTQRDTKIQTLARFTVQAGRHVVEQG